MLARSVARGTLPSPCFCVRAISDPPSRPETRTLQPKAPICIVVESAFLTVLRKEARFSSCSAMFSINL